MNGLVGRINGPDGVDDSRQTLHVVVARVPNQEILAVGPDVKGPGVALDRVLLALHPQLEARISLVERRLDVVGVLVAALGTPEWLFLVFEVEGGRARVMEDLGEESELVGELSHLQEMLLYGFGVRGITESTGHKATRVVPL